MKKNYGNTQELCLLSPTSCQHCHIVSDLQKYSTFSFFSPYAIYILSQLPSQLPFLLGHHYLCLFFLTFLYFRLFFFPLSPPIKRKIISRAEDKVRPCKPWVTCTAAQMPTPITGPNGQHSWNCYQLLEAWYLILDTRL